VEQGGDEVKGEGEVKVEGANDGKRRLEVQRAHQWQWNGTQVSGAVKMATGDNEDDGIRISDGSSDVRGGVGSDRDAHDSAGTCATNGVADEGIHKLRGL